MTRKGSLMTDEDKKKRFSGKLEKKVEFLRGLRSRGRPPIPDSEKKVRNITFRSRGKMHERLSEAAANNGRSLSEEIEARLAQSFDIEERMTAFRETWEKRVEDWRHISEQRREELEQL